MVLNKIKSTVVLLLIVMAAMLLSSCEEEAPNPNDTKPVVNITKPGKSEILLVDTEVEIEASDDKGITRVELYFDRELDTLNRVFTSPPYRWTLPLDSLRDSTVHLLYAKAYDVEGNVSISPWVAVYISKFLPPENLSVQYITKDSLELRWEDKTKHEKNFEVFLSNDGVDFNLLQTLKADKKSSTVVMPFSRTGDYYFRVRGIRDSIASPYSKTVKVYFGSGGENLFAGGKFETAGGTTVKNIARWDADKWSSAGAGVNDIVLTMATYNNELFVGGNFPGNIARWNGSAWSPAGDGFNGKVNALALYRGELYAGGLFNKSGSNDVPHIAKWNGYGWVSVGKGFNAAVQALAVYRDELYATGDFTKSGTDQMNHIAKWDIISDTLAYWSQLYNGLDGKGFALAVYNDELYVGGNMRLAGGVNVNYIAKWNGSFWSSAGDGFDNIVYALHVHNFELYAGGMFTSSGSATTEHLAKISGDSWTYVGGKNGVGIDAGQPGSYVHSFETFNGSLYIGGKFMKAGNIVSQNITRWNGVSWDQVGGGPGSIVYSLATFTADSWQWVRLP